MSHQWRTATCSCWPDEISNQGETILDALRFSMKELILNPAFVEGDSLEQAVVNQVERTLHILQNTLNAKSFLSDDYTTRLQQAYDLINQTEEKKRYESLMATVSLLKK